MTNRTWGLLSLTHYYRVPSSQANQEKRVIALDRLSLSQPFGEIVGLIGGKGSGKETLMRILTGEIEPTEGLVSGRPDTVGSLELPDQRSKERTGESYTRRKLQKWQLSKNKIPQVTEDIHDFSELGSRFSKKLKYYTLEEKIQLEVSILLHVAPSLIYIDESLLTVKEHFYIKVFFYLLKLKEIGSSIWVKTANIKRIEGYCDKLVWLEFGHLQQHGEVKEVLRSYEEYYSQIDHLTYKEQKKFWEEGYHEQLVGKKVSRKTTDSDVLRELDHAEVGLVLTDEEGEVLSRTVARHRKRRKKRPNKRIWLMTGGVFAVVVAAIFFVIKFPIFKGKAQQELPNTARVAETSSQPPVSSSSNQTEMKQTAASIESTENQETPSEFYVVKAGDSLSQIAERYKLSVQQLKDWNHLTSDEIILNQKLTIKASIVEEVTEKIAAANFTHVVTSGDTLLEIAEKYGVSVTDLQAVNQLANLTIYAGTELSLPAAAKIPTISPAPEPVSSPATTVPVTHAAPPSERQHMVSSGETLYGIAKRYGVDIMEIQRMNFLQTEQLEPGQQLRIP